MGRKSAQNVSSQTVSQSPARVTVKLTGDRSVTVYAANLNLDSFIAVLDELQNHARQAHKKRLTLDTFRKIQLDQSKSTT